MNCELNFSNFTYTKLVCVCIYLGGLKFLWQWVVLNMNSVYFYRNLFNIFINFWIKILHKFYYIHWFSSVQFSRSVVSDTLWPHELQHTRPPCPSPTPRVHSDSRPLSQWCHPAISPSVIPFSSCPQSLLASVFSSESTLPWGGQSTGVSALASVLPNKSQG